MPVSRTAVLGLIAAFLASASLAHAQSTQPSKNPITKSPPAKSPLKRTKTKLKAPAPDRTTTSAPRPAKPLEGVRPVGRAPGRHTTASGVEAYQRNLVAPARLRRTVRGNTSGQDMNVSLDNGDTATVSPVFTGNGMTSKDRAMRNLAEAYRDGRRPASGQEARDIARGNTRDVDGVRDDYLSRGYQEARLSSGETVFVKSAAPGAAGNVVNMLQDRVSQRMFDDWRDGWNRYDGTNNWTYSGATGGCRSCSGGGGGGIVCSPTPQLDAFILRGTIDSRELSEVEMAELDMTDGELAQSALSRHDFPLAVDRYGSYLKKTPEDAVALRGYGIALLQTKQYPEAVAKIADAYCLDPTLGAQPIPMDHFADGSTTVAELLQRLVPLAHKSTSYHASLASAALMQAQGRGKESARMIERAKSKGLPDAVEREFRAADLPAPSDGK